MLRILTLTLCLTHDCNLRCRYCYAGRKYRHAMSQQVAARAIDIALAEALRTCTGLDISFFGGEPLLEWELLQWCTRYLREHADVSRLPVAPRFAITTNMTLLTEQKLEWLAEQGFLIGLSLDGSPAMHNINRRFASGEGSHAATLPALAWLNAHPKVRSRAICVVTPSNAHLLAEGVSWMAAHYDGPIGLNFDYWSRWTDEQFEVLAAQYREMMRRVADSYRGAGEGGPRPMRVESVRSKILSHLRSREGDADKPCVHCRIGEREIAVTVDGNFFPCSRLVGEGDAPELNFGNVQEGINRAKQLAIIATRGNVTPECLSCSLRHRCLNTCGCTNRAASGYLNRVSPFLCCLERLCIEEADAMAEALYAERCPAFMEEFYGSSSSTP